MSLSPAAVSDTQRTWATATPVAQPLATLSRIAFSARAHPAGRFVSGDVNAPPTREAHTHAIAVAVGCMTVGVALARARSA